MTFVPLSEWCGINLYNGTLYQCLGSYKFIVTGIVHNINDSGLSRKG